jgi:penicillin amidase
MIQVFIFIIFFSNLSMADNSCSSHYDHLSIPHVKTKSMDEYYYCFGLHHGRDRAWEMDYFRRVAEGKNAMILGYKHLKSDLMMRLLDLPSEVDRLWPLFDKDKKKILQLYAQGVNQGFKTGVQSQEFKDFDYVPRPWRPQDSLLILLLQSFDQTRKTFFRDYEEELHKEKWGLKTVSLFDDNNVPWKNTILKEGEYEKKKTLTQTTSFSNVPFKIWQDFPSVFGTMSGSNNWVVSKKKSQNGHAMLANDPHLDLKTPMFWYWISFQGPHFKIMGGTVPGVPVFANGTNGKVAWGLTNSYLNSADAIFLSDIKKDQIKMIRPLVYVKWWIFKIPFFFKSFEKLKTGEVILPLETKSKHKLVLNWTGFNLRPEEISSLFDVDTASNVKEIDEKLSLVGIPSWNYVFADINGDIGYRLVGKTFKHNDAIPYGIPVKTYKEFLNQKYLEVSERPHVMKPKRQYIYSANNRHWPEDSKFHGGRAYSLSFRGFRIDELLQGDQSLESFKNIQCDRQVVDSRFFIPKIKKYLNWNDLLHWNMIAEDSSKILPVYRRMMDLLMEKWGLNDTALFNLLDHLDRKKISEMKEIYQQAVVDAQGRNWGEFHRVHFSHISNNVEWNFSPDIPGVGDVHSVDPGAGNWNTEKKIYEQQSGASMRMIIELKKTPSVWLSLPGLNRNYDQRKNNSAWLNWKNCHYDEVFF